jgi:hypothetical protein
MFLMLTLSDNRGPIVVNTARVTCMQPACLVAGSLVFFSENGFVTVDETLNEILACLPQESK